VLLLVTLLFLSSGLLVVPSANFAFCSFALIMSEVAATDIEADRWIDVHNILTVPGPFAQETFEPGLEVCCATLYQ